VVTTTAPACAVQLAQVGDGPLDLAAVRRRRLGGEHDDVVVEVLVGGERLSVHHGRPSAAGVLAHLHEVR
jgi:hypothetical protein